MGTREVLPLSEASGENLNALVWAEKALVVSEGVPASS
jgi:hypothetical protein